MACAALNQIHCLKRICKKWIVAVWGFSIALLTIVMLASPDIVIASTVIIKPNSKVQANSDIFIKQQKNSAARHILTVSEVYRSHYHPAEYHNGYLYIIRRRTGGNYANNKNPQWSDELWRYDRHGAGTKLWSSKGLDFRVSDENELVAILARSNEDTRNELRLITSEGKLVRTFSAQELVLTDAEFEQWIGQYLWLKDQDETDIKGFVRIDTRSKSIRRYDLRTLNLQDEDYALNATSLILAYSDYPVMFDVDTSTEFVKRKTPVKLYIYDLEKRRSRRIAQSTAKPFNPQWVDAETLEYNKPTGKGRIQTDIH